MEYPILYRERLLPKECIHLKDDEIVSYDEKRMVTKWKALKPRKDLHHGFSVYFFEEGYKVSKFLREDGSLLYWYCDIIDARYEKENNALIVRDLLADVIIMPDGFVKVVDIGEMADLYEEGALTKEDMGKALRSLDALLTIIYDGRFSELSKYMMLES